LVSVPFALYAKTAGDDVLKENAANKSTDFVTDAASDVKFPSVKSVKTYVDTQYAPIDALIAGLEATVGDYIAGGVVFWVDPADNTRGLVCAIEDQSAAIRWHNGSFITTGATGTGIGTGSANTTAIIVSQGALETAYAAGLARAYRGGGYTDWFLPSKDELNEMYINKSKINTAVTANGGSVFIEDRYWSSSEIADNYAWRQYFNTSTQSGIYKGTSQNVRAVRAFSNSLVGAQGIQGATGSAGADGANGEKGATGDQGAAGLTTAVNAIAQIGGNITITTTDIPEGDNKYYTDALVSVNTTVIANTDKVGITAQQSDAITTNTDKVGYTEALVSANADVVLNKSKVGQAAGTTTGDMQYWNGTTWVVVAAGAAGQELTMNSGATAPEWVTPNSTVPTLAIGQVYQGGIIFYLDASGKHGLIAAPSDQSTWIQWYNGAYTNTTAFASCVGCGDGNTSRIVYSNGSGSYAAKLCYDLNLGGNTDWYLPSKYELNLMYQNIGKGNALGLGNIGNFANNFYWSSTELDLNSAWNQYFGNGHQNDNFKFMTDYVRAVRAF
jgi:hypothetical protein